MKFLFSLLFSLLCVAGFARVKVILDADIDSDVDDVGALAMLLNLHKCGAIDLAGIVVTSNDPYAPLCVESIVNWYGEAAIPIAFLQGQEQLTNHSRYTRQITEEFPTARKSHEDFPDAAALYRELLSRSGDLDVVIVTIGHLSSFQKLLQSEPDGFSSLSGKELAHTKVKTWLCMGGLFPEGKEANFYRPDPASTVYCLANWENDVVFCGWEIGNEIVTGGDYLKERAEPASPLYRGYELYNNFQGRASWDQVAILPILEEFGDYFTISRDGRCEVDDTGYNRWVKGPASNHGYVVFKNGYDREKIARFTDDLMLGNPEVLRDIRWDIR